MNKYRHSISIFNSCLSFTLRIASSSRVVFINALHSRDFFILCISFHFVWSNSFDSPITDKYLWIFHFFSISSVNSSGAVCRIELNFIRILPFWSNIYKDIFKVNVRAWFHYFQSISQLEAVLRLQMNAAVINRFICLMVERSLAIVPLWGIVNSSNKKLFTFQVTWVITQQHTTITTGWRRNMESETAFNLMAMWGRTWSFYMRWTKNGHYLKRE